MLGRKPSSFCDKLFHRVVKTDFKVYIGTRWAETLSDENLTFFVVPTVRESVHFFRKLYDWVVGTAFQLAIASFWEEVSAVIFPPIIFGHWAKPLRNFFEFLSTALSKLHSSCPEELFELKNVCKSCRVLFITFGLSAKKILLSGKKSSPVFSKGHSTCLWDSFKEKVSFGIFFVTFGNWSENSPFCRKIFVRFVRTSFYLSQESWSGGNKFKGKFLEIFCVRTSIEKFPAFCRSFFHRVVKTAFYVSIATFWSFV